MNLTVKFEFICSVRWFFFVGEARVLLSIEVASDEPASDTQRCIHRGVRIRNQ